MKTAEELDSLALHIYWQCEHGQQAMARLKLQQIQLDAMREGMRMAATLVSTHWNHGSTMCNQAEQALHSSNVLYRAAESLTEKDL